MRFNLHRLYKITDSIGQKLFIFIDEIISEYELCWYLLIEQIRKFRNKSGADLEYLIGHSDDSVKNYNKDDIYPIILR